MKRRFFLVAGAGSLIAARLATVPALAFEGTRTRVARASVRRHLADTGIPGGCNSHRKRSMHDGYTLAYALAGLAITS